MTMSGALQTWHPQSIRLNIKESNMADAREQSVWSNHAIKDHTNKEPYEFSDNIDYLLGYTENVKTVIDIGCGSGLWRPCFKQFDYVGVDQNPHMIDIAKGRMFPSIGRKTEFMLGNAMDSNVLERIKDKGIDLDLVWFSAVLQHNREIDKIVIMNNLHDFIDKGEYLMFTENTFTPTNYNPPFLRFEEGQTDGWSYTQKGWINFIEQYGFKKIKNEPANFYLFRKA